MQESLSNAVRQGSEGDVREILWNHRRFIRLHISNLVTKVDDLLFDPFSEKKNSEKGEGEEGWNFAGEFSQENISASPYFSFRKRFENVRYDALFTVTRFFEPIHFAALFGHEKIMRVLLEDREEDLRLLNELEATRNRLLGFREGGRAATDELTVGDDERQQQQHIASAIETACSHITGYLSHVKANLLDVNAGNKGQRHTALHIAANRGDLRMVRLLVEGLLQSPRATKSGEGYTGGNAEVVDNAEEFSAVAGAHAKTNCVNVSNLTPAWFAASRGHKKVFEYLVRHGGFAPEAEAEDQNFGRIWAENAQKTSSGAAGKQNSATFNAEDKKGVPPTSIGSEEINRVDPSSLSAYVIASAAVTASDVAKKKESASTKKKSDASAAGFLFSSLSCALCIAAEMGYKGIVSYIASTILLAPRSFTLNSKSEEAIKESHSPLIANSPTTNPCIRCRSAMLGDALLFAAAARRLEVLKVLVGFYVYGERENERAVRGSGALGRASPLASSQPQCALCCHRAIQLSKGDGNTIEAYDFEGQRIADLSLALTAACRGDAQNNNTSSSSSSSSSRPDPRFGAGMESYIFPDAKKKKQVRKLTQRKGEFGNDSTHEDEESEVEEEEEEEVPCDRSKLTDVVSFLLEHGARSDMCLFSEVAAREVRLPAFLLEKKHTQAGAAAEGAIGGGANRKPPSHLSTIKPRPARLSPRPLPPLIPADRDRRPPLHFLVCDGSLEGVKLLLHGGSTNPTGPGNRGEDVSFPSTVTDASGETALFFLPEFCQSWVVRNEGRGSTRSALHELITLLTSHGADLNFVSSTTSLTPLSSAAKKCCKDSVSALLSFSGSEEGGNLPVSGIKLQAPTVDPRLGQPFSTLVYATRVEVRRNGMSSADMYASLTCIIRDLMCAGASLFESADHLLLGVVSGNERGILKSRIIDRTLAASAQHNSNLHGDGMTRVELEEDLLFLAMGMTSPASSRLFNLVRSECESLAGITAATPATPPLPPPTPTSGEQDDEEGGDRPTRRKEWDSFFYSPLSPLCHALKCYDEQQRLEAYLQLMERTKGLVGFACSSSNDESLMIEDSSFFDFCLNLSTKGGEGGERAVRDLSHLEPTSRKLCPPSFHYRKALALVADLLLLHPHTKGAEASKESDDEVRKFTKKEDDTVVTPPPPQIVSVMRGLMDDLPLCCDNSLVQPVDAVLLSDREGQRILNARGRKFDRLLSKLTAGASPSFSKSEGAESFIRQCKEEKEQVACESHQGYTNHMLPSLTPHFWAEAVTNSRARDTRHDPFFPHRCLDVAISRVRLQVCELLLLFGASVNAIPPFLVTSDGDADGARHLPTVVGENEGPEAKAKAKVVVDENNEKREREVTRDFYRLYESTSMRNEDWDWDEGEPPLTRVGSGNTPLHMACYYVTKCRNPDGLAAEIVSALLDRGADPSALNDDGQTPLQVLGSASALFLPETVLLLTFETGPQY